MSHGWTGSSSSSLLGLRISQQQLRRAEQLSCPKELPAKGWAESARPSDRGDVQEGQPSVELGAGGAAAVSMTWPGSLLRRDTRVPDGYSLSPA